MSVSFHDDGGDSWNFPSEVVTFSHDVSTNSNRLLVVSISVEGSNDASYVQGVKYNGTSMTLVSQTIHDIGYATTSELYYLLNPDTGTNDVEITFGTNGEWAAAKSADFYDVAQTAPNDIQTHHVYGTSISTTVTPTNSENLIVASIGHGEPVSLTIDSPGILFGAAETTDQNSCNGGYIIDGSTDGQVIKFNSPVEQRFVTVSATWNYTTGPDLVITTYNGCTSSGNTTATVTAILTKGSGNTQIYYGNTDGGTTKSSWHYSSSKLLKYDTDGGWSVTLPVDGDTTPFTPSTQYYYTAYVSSNGWDAGEDWASESIEFITAPAITCDKDLLIYYNSSLSAPNYICCWCSRWNVDNFDTIIETWLTKSQLKTLRDNITPGAAGELYQILGSPTFYDQTWEGKNTLRIASNDNSTSTLYKMRNDKIIYVKNISTSPIAGASGYLAVKIEGYISGSVL